MSNHHLRFTTGVANRVMHKDADLSHTAFIAIRGEDPDRWGFTVYRHKTYEGQPLTDEQLAAVNVLIGEAFKLGKRVGKKATQEDIKIALGV